MPGPDQIPYSAWRQLGETGIDILWEAMKELKEKGAEKKLEEAYREVEGQVEGHEFNLSIMVCLPKAPVGSTEDDLDIYEAAGTRPLAIVNTDNRIVANAARARYEEIFQRWISKMQKGFIKGRSMLSNIVVIDQKAMRISLRCKQGAIILFDFKAAFPSVERGFMMETIRWLGMPEAETNLIEALYNNTTAMIRLGGHEGNRFDMSRGIRQGCPLSPIIFAVIVDMLLRKLDRTLGEEGCTRAFADDTAVVTNNIFEKLRDIAKLFEEYGQLSGLDLNYNKTIIVPLWLKREDGEEGEHQEGDEHYGELRALLRDIGRGWEAVQGKIGRAHV